MPVTSEDFRRLALSFPETSEDAHMGHPDFRVRGKIFATLGYPDTGSAMVKLTPEQQQIFASIEPAVFAPAKGGWGRQGSTNVSLEVAAKTSVERALLTAWGNAAPKRLAREFDAQRFGEKKPAPAAPRKTRKAK